MERKIIAYPKPNVTCYSVLANGSSLDIIERRRYHLEEDTSHATHTLILFLGARQNYSGTYRCVLSNIVGSANVVLQVVTYTEDVSIEPITDTEDVTRVLERLEQSESAGQGKPTIVLRLLAVSAFRRHNKAHRHVL